MFRLFIIFCYAVVQVYGLFRARLQKEVLKSGGVSPVAPDETHAAIPLTFVNDQYIGRISVGTPPQYFSVIFDLGSAYTWVPGSQCMSVACRRHVRYVPQMSATFSSPFDLNSETFLQFGSGTLSFNEGKDIVCLQPTYCVPNQTIGLVTKEQDSVFTSVPFDGIVGLALPGLTGSDSESLIHTLVHKAAAEHFDDDRHRSALPKGQQSLYIVYDLSSRVSPTLSFTHTALDHSQLETPFRRPLFWFNTYSDTYWTLPLVDIIVDEIPLGVCTSVKGESCQATLDTGTAEILGTLSMFSPAFSEKTVDLLCFMTTSFLLSACLSGHSSAVRLVRNAIGLNRPCISWTYLRPITFRFQESKDKPAVDISLTPAQLLSYGTTAEPPDCRKGFVAGSMFEPTNRHTSFDAQSMQWILGHAFIRNIHLVLDPQHRRVGIGRVDPQNFTPWNDV